MKGDNKIAASSLFETIVALMVIMIVFGIGMTIYVNVMKNSTSLSELKASLKLEELVRETKKNKSYFDENFKDSTTYIEKRVKKYNNVEGLLLIDLQIYDHTNKRLAELKEIIEEE